MRILLFFDFSDFRDFDYLREILLINLSNNENSLNPRNRKMEIRLILQRFVIHSFTLEYLIRDSLRIMLEPQVVKVYLIEIQP